MSGVLAEEATDPRAQLCTVAENFFRSTSSPTPESMRSYLRGINPAFMDLFTKRPLPAMFRTLSQAQASGQFSQKCEDVLPPTSVRRSQGQGFSIQASRTSADAPPSVLAIKRMSQPVDEQEIPSDVDYCNPNFCSLSDVEAQGNALCGIAQAVTPVPSQARQNPQCTCLQSKCLRFDAPQAIQDVRSAVLRSYGRRFLNNFAQLREDVIFYEGRIRQLPGDQFRCTDFAGFESKVNRQCGNQPGSQERMQEVLNAFYNLSPGTASSMFSQTNDQIRRPGADGYTRAFIDYNRQLLTLNPAIRAVEKMVQDCLVGSSVFRNGEWVRERVTLENSSLSPQPFQKMAQLMRRKAFEDPALFLRTYFGQTNDIRFREFREYLNNPANRDSDASTPNIFEVKLLELMNGHPGFDVLLSNETFAKRINARDIQGPGGIRGWLESPNSKWPENLQERCGNFQKNFADLVCASDEDLVRQLGRTELQQIVSDESNDPNMNSTMIDRLRCQLSGNLEGMTGGIFRRLRESTPDSDYFRRMMSPVDNSTGSVIADNVNRDPEGYFRSLREGAAVGSGSVKAYDPTGDEIATALFTEHPEIRVSSLTNDVADNSGGSGSYKEAEKRSLQDGGRTQNPDTSSPQRQGTSPVATTPIIYPSSQSPTSESEAKKSLRDSLAQGAQRDTVNRMVSNLDDDTAGELARLREEVARSKSERIDEMSSRADQLSRQIRNLEQEQSRLQALREDSRNTDANVSRRPASVDREDSTPTPVRNVPLRNPQTQNPQANQNGNTSAGSANLDAPSASASSAARLGPGGSTVRAGGITVSRYEPAVNGGPVTVDAQSSPGNSGSSPEELSTNIRRYLEQNNLDLRTLIQIKESGVVYRYRVTEGGQSVEREMLISYDTLSPEIRNLIDQKIERSRATPAQIESISQDIRIRKRNYSYETLRAIIIGSANGTL